MEIYFKRAIYAGCYKRWSEQSACNTVFTQQPLPNCTSYQDYNPLRCDAM